MRFFIVIGFAIALAVTGGTVIAESLTKSMHGTIAQYDSFMQAADNAH
jgi:hypothetical protein